MKKGSIFFLLLILISLVSSAGIIQENLSKIKLPKNIISSINLSNLSDKDYQNLTNFSLSSTKGKIKFKKSINISKEINLTNKISIEYNRIYIDSKNIPELNVAAQLELSGLTFTNPRILKNGKPCSKYICKNAKYLNGTLTFEVNSFSEYKAEETPYCGDKICQSDETHYSCSIDCEETKNSKNIFKNLSKKLNNIQDTESQKENIIERFKKLPQTKKTKYTIGILCLILIITILIRLKYESVKYGSI
jgi:hypothetical protein